MLKAHCFVCCRPTLSISMQLTAAGIGKAHSLNLRRLHCALRRLGNENLCACDDLGRKQDLVLQLRWLA